MILIIYWLTKYIIFDEMPNFNTRNIRSMEYIENIVMMNGWK